MPLLFIKRIGENKMSIIHEKWRESLIDINDIKFKKVKIEEVVSYPPAGNDVFECIGTYKNKKTFLIFKSERGSYANFLNEIKVLEVIKNYFQVPRVIEWGVHDNRTYMVMKKIEGEKLSDLFKSNLYIDKSKYLYNYGKTLAKIHALDIKWDKARQRDINDYPKRTIYKDLNKWENEIIDYLKTNKPKRLIKNTFIHGDFHYGNILWSNYNISGILDWEYSGIGLKEQDIAWALILRPEQKFLDSKEDINSFLDGYRSIGSYNKEILKWCYINGMMHFYLMNKNNSKETYLSKLKKQICELVNIN